jgi:hypothetical protein
MVTTNEHHHKNGTEPGIKRLPQAMILAGIYVGLIILFFILKAPSLDITQFTLERQSKSFLLVSTLKSSLAIIEGSDVGVGFRLELGDVVQSAYDLVDFGWKMLLYGILLITFSKIFIESNLINTGVYILGLGFVVRIASLFLSTYKEKILSLGSAIIVAGLIVSFYVPVSTFVSFHACEFFVDHIENDMNDQMQAALEEWETFKSAFSLNKFKDSLQSAASSMKALFLNLTRVLITYTCLIIIRYLLFPMIVAYGFFIVSKTFLQKRLDAKRL